MQGKVLKAMSKDEENQKEPEEENNDEWNIFCLQN